jgi:hypothetical protein
MRATLMRRESWKTRPQSARIPRPCYSSTVFRPYSEDENNTNKEKVFRGDSFNEPLLTSKGSMMLNGVVGMFLKTLIRLYNVLLSIRGEALNEL